ncbi:MAG: hypothetical protein L0Y71_07855 [Gemmataceae bacterium]|nr:hypothetical protein [Gemmataceae bacterium]
MGHSLSLLTAALLVGQTPHPYSGVSQSGRNCSCNNGTRGYIVASPDYYRETQQIGGWKRGSTMTTEWRSSSEWRSSDWQSVPSETSWMDNRPILSRFRSWFRGDSPAPSRMETVPGAQPIIGQPVIVSPGTGHDYYRRLPTTSEPPLNKVPAQPVVRPEGAAPSGAAPSSLRPAPAATPLEKQSSDKPLSVEVAPIEFRPAGHGMAGHGSGVTPAIATSTAANGAAVAPAMVAPAPMGAAALGTPSVGTPSVPTPTVPVSSAAPARPSPISARFADKVGQPGDYSWITGQLEIRNGAYLLHYASPDTIDRFNGSLPLATEANLSTFRSGDLVSVHGNVVQQGRSTAYRVRSIDLIER